MHIDDSYEVQRVLAEGVGGVTELVTADGSGPFVRKKMPHELARRRVWSALAECDCARLPQVEATYELPEQFVVVYDFVPGTSLERQVEGESPSACVGECDEGVAARSPQSASNAGEADLAVNSKIVGTPGLSLADAVRMACEVCEAAQALHEQGVVHRDISPANVIMATDGAHLIDLGIARLRVEGATRDTASLGTWGFASPEQYGFAQTDARSDVYSIGRLLGFAITGVTPGGKEYDAALTGAAIVPPSLRQVIDKACAFEPSARFQSAAELAGAIRNACKNDFVFLQEQQVSGQNLLVRASENAKRNCEEMTQRKDDIAFPSATRASRKRSGRGVDRKRNGRKTAYTVIFVAAMVVALGMAAAYVVTQGQGSAIRQDEAARKDTSDITQYIANDTSSKSQDLLSSNVVAKDAAAVLELGENGWSSDSSGYVFYAFELTNSSTMNIDFPSVNITGYAEDGSVLFADTQTLCAIGAGQTIYFASQAGGGGVPATVTIEPVAPLDYQVKPATRLTEFAISNVSQTKDALGLPHFTGMLSVADAGGEDASMVAVSAVLRNESGDIVGGFSTFLNRPVEGESVAFDIPVYGDIAFAAYDIYVQVW